MTLFCFQNGRKCFIQLANKLEYLFTDKNGFQSSLTNGLNLLITLFITI